MREPLPAGAVTELRNQKSTNIDELSVRELVELMNREDATVAEAVSRESGAIAEAIERVTECLGRGGRLIYLGAGTSGRLGVLDASECPPTFGVRRGLVIGLIAGGESALTSAVEGAEDNRAAGASDLAALEPGVNDAVMGIAASGRTPYVLGGLELAGACGCLRLGLACNPGSVMASMVDIMIAPVVGPEILTGSTRLKSGTATKMVLNMLTTGVMIRLGKTYGNLMVDLNASNEKLRDRSERMVSELAGVSRAEAAGVLGRCGGEVKTAIVVIRRGLGVEEARGVLLAAGGQLRGALESRAGQSG